MLDSIRKILGLGKFDHEGEDLALDPMSLVSHIEDRVEKEDPSGGKATWFAVDPDVMYPAMVKHITKILKTGKLPLELIDREPADPMVDEKLAARRYLMKAREVPAKGWELALSPPVDYAQVVEIQQLQSEHGAALPPEVATRIAELRFTSAKLREQYQEEVQARAAALEVARLWFTRALKNETKPIGLHIMKDLKYRL